MKITVPIVSRNRPTQLLSVLTSLDCLSSGKHHINYVLIVDEDDEPTLKILRDNNKYLPINTFVRVGKRDKILNSRMNDAMDEFSADYYTFLPDDGFPLSHQWDEMFDGLKELPAFAWCEKNDPKNATFLCISERWRRATGRGFPEYFPFWFADTWLMEVHLLAFAKPIGIVQQLGMGGKRGTTQGMRDLKFWFDFYSKTRKERIEEAQRVAKAWGLTFTLEDRKDQLALLEQMDQAQLTKISDYEEQFKSDLGEPTELYLKAKARAEAWR